MGLVGTNGELGFHQCRFHPTMPVLRVCAVCAFSAPPAFPPCACPFCLSAPVRRLTSRISSASSPDSSGIRCELLRRTARHERTLEAVACKPLFGIARWHGHRDYPPVLSPARASLCDSDPGCQDPSRLKTVGRLKTKPCPYRRFHYSKLCWGKSTQFSEQFYAWDRDQILGIKHPRAQKARGDRHFKA